MTDCEKILAGTAKIEDFDLDTDFECEELGRLLEAGVITPREISLWRASDLIIDQIVDYSTVPFEDFSPDEQIRQLFYHAIAPEEFAKRVDLDWYDADEWLELLALMPEFADRAPWETLRGEGSDKKWEELLKASPEFAKYRQ